MQRAIFRICILFILLTWSIPISGLGASGDFEGDEFSLVVRVKDNLLTVKVKDIPLKYVLSKIAKQTSIKVTLHVPTEDPIFADFSDLPVEKGLKRLTRDYSSIFIYGLEKGKGGEPEIEEVIICAERGGTPDKRPRPRTIDSKKWKKPHPGSSETSPLGSQIQGFRDKDRLVRQKSVESMALSKDDSLMVHLGKVLAKDQDEDVRDRAAQRLGDLGDEMAIIPLVQALRDKNSRVRENAAEALCKIGGANVIRALEGCLSGKDDDLKKIAGEALKELKAVEEAD